MPGSGSWRRRIRRPESSDVIACDKREAFAQGSEATKQSILSLLGEMDCFAPLAMTRRVSLAPRNLRGSTTAEDARYVHRQTCQTNANDPKHTCTSSYSEVSRENRKLQWSAPPASVCVLSRWMPRVA